MDLKVKIPYGGSHISLCIYNVPSWFWWVIVVSVGGYLALTKLIVNF